MRARFLVISIFAAICNLLIAQATQSRTAAQPAGYQIGGTLVDAITGQPVAKARVAISPVAERNDFTTLVTGEDGRFFFGNLAAGKYTLTAQARGYLLESFNQHDQYSSSIVVGPDLVSTGLVFHLPQESKISGEVADEAGEAVREAQVTLYFTGLAAGTEGTRVRGHAITDDEGAYHFGHLPPGHYLIAVSARPWYAQHKTLAPQGTAAFQNPDGLRGRVISSGGAGADEQPNPQLDVAYPITFFPGVTEPADATPIALGKGEKATANISLQPVPALHIRINKEETEQGKSINFILQRRVLDGPPMSVSTEMREVAPGVMEIVGLPAGRYTIRNYTSGVGETDWTGSRELDLTGNDEIDSRQGAQYVPVTAKLQVRSGTLPGQAFLVLSSKKTREGFAERVNSSGQLVFKQGVPPGAYEVSLSSATGLYLAGITAEGAKVNGRTVEFHSGAAVKLSITVAHGEAEVTGTALRDGKPLAGVMVVLVPADPAHNQVLFRRDQSDSDGTFTLPTIVPGDYKVLAIENGWELEWTKPEVLEKFMAGAVAVQAQPSGKYNVKINVQ